MDTSKEYIKMCDCEDIQGLSPDSGDSSGQLWYCRECKEIATEDDGYSYCKSGCDGNYIWLPRQDQLQEMLLTDEYKRKENVCSGMCLLENHFSYFVDELKGNECYDTSFEQLWLAFVMKEKFNKTWSGKKWIV